MLETLDEYGVAHVVIGGVAARAHGDPSVTFDLDLTPDPDPENLARLAEALTAMDARLRPPDSDPVSMELDGSVIGRFSTLATRTRFGDLDVVVRPDGIPGGYKQLAENACNDHAFGVKVAIASVPDLVESRRESARLTGLTRYEQLADRLEALGTERDLSLEDDGLDLGP